MHPQKLIITFCLFRMLMKHLTIARMEYPISIQMKLQMVNGSLNRNPLHLRLIHPIRTALVTGSAEAVALARTLTA